ncbi:MAG: DUF5652 family protein [Paludibacter sp.]|nr:DUF5652 family protein [Paludibacter sp.]
MCCNLENFHWKMAPYEWLFVILILWDFTWKVIALWKAARNNQLAWFICIAVFNTIGILPIIYILRDMRNRMAKEL